MVYSTLMGVGVTAVTIDLYYIYKRNRMYKNIVQPVEVEKVIILLEEKLDKIKRTRLTTHWVKYKHKRNKYLLKYNYIHSVESIEAYLTSQLHNIHNEINKLDKGMTKKQVKDYKRKVIKLLKGVEHQYTYE